MLMLFILVMAMVGVCWRPAQWIPITYICRRCPCSVEGGRKARRMPSIYEKIVTTLRVQDVHQTENMPGPCVFVGFDDYLRQSVEEGSTRCLFRSPPPPDPGWDGSRGLVQWVGVVGMDHRLSGEYSDFGRCDLPALVCLEVEGHGDPSTTAGVDDPRGGGTRMGDRQIPSLGVAAADPRPPGSTPPAPVCLVA